MDREELESVIWEEAPYLSYSRPRAARTAAMETILRAADAYAATTVGEFAALPPRDKNGRWARKAAAC